MKLPVFHKYYTINTLFYLLLINMIIICCGFYYSLAFLFKIPLDKLSVYCHIIYYLNVYIIPLIIGSIIIELILRLTKILKTNLQVINFSFSRRFFLYLFISFAFMVFGTMNTLCKYSQIPYTPQELEQLRYD